MREYNSYIDSGIEWIGRIPTNWTLSKLKFMTSLRMGETILKEQLVEDGEIPVYSATESHTILGYVNESLFTLEAGDIVIPARGNSIGFVKLLTHQAVSTQTTIACFTDKQKVNPTFLFYYLVGLKPQIFHFDQTAIPQITVDQVKNKPVTLPPCQEQTQIARYLDYKTAKIDALIEKKQRLIELLEEERKAIINQAVTKGLNPDAPMKDSGIDWLGDIPEHWEVKRLKYLSTEIKTGSTPPSDVSEYYQNGTIDWFGPGDFQQIELHDSNKKITQKAIEEGKAKLYPPNSVLLVGIGATVGKVGICLKPCSSNQQINAISLDENLYDPFLLVNYMMSIKDYILSESDSATLPIFNQTDTKNIPVCTPPPSEQKVIVEHIKKELRRVKKLLDMFIREIELLNEYKTALISEVVTGKVDVRDEVIPE